MSERFDAADTIDRSQSCRYAIFYAPPANSALWAFGSTLIGYDAETGESLTPFAPERDWLALTEEPRRYGFHGTLRAPFRLRDGTSDSALLASAKALASRWRPFVMPPLRVELLDAFVALAPAVASPTLDELAAECVGVCDALRAPLTETDRARRVPSRLSARQIAHMDRWGYPYVFEDFRFHMTLTGSLPEGRREPVRSEIERRFGTLGEAIPVDSIAIFRQRDRAAPFRVLARIPFGA